MSKSNRISKRHGVPINITPRFGQHVYILDTCVCLHDWTALKAFQDNMIVLPIVVVEEIDNKKVGNGIGYNARQTSRYIEDLRLKGDINKGVITENGGILIADRGHAPYSCLPSGVDRKKNDNLVLLCALRWKEAFPDTKVALISKDVNMRIKADMMGIIAEDYKTDKQLTCISQLYSGFIQVEVPIEKHDILKQFFEGNIVYEDELLPYFPEKPVPNICCEFACGEGSFRQTYWAIYKENHKFFFHVSKPRKLERSEHKVIIPRNREQCFAYALATDNDLTLATFAGKAGTGKTIMALLAGYNQLRDYKGYKRLLVFRPNVEAGGTMGFLPGDRDEKFEPWKRAIIQNLYKIDGEIPPPMNPPIKTETNTLGLEELLKREIIRIESVNFSQGSTEDDTFLIVDEAQNFTPQQSKLMGTRIGNNSKGIFLGDTDQIYNPFLDEISNGLVHAIVHSKGSELYGHIKLTRNERSKTADFIANRW